MATMRSKVGQLEILKQEGMKKRWKGHMFKVSGSTYLLYFKSGDMSRPDGQLLLSSITKVEVNNAPKGADFPFEVHFKGKPMQGHSGSPWILNASSNEERLQWMDAIKPGSSANLRAFSERSTLRVAEREHYQQEYRRIQPSPPPSYPPPQLSDAADHSPRSPIHTPQQAPPSFTMPPNVKPAKTFDANASWHGRPNVYRNPDVGRNNSLPSPDEGPQPYLDPELLPPVRERSTVDGQRGGGGFTLAPAPAGYDSRSMPRNFERPGSHQFAHTNGGPPPAPLHSDDRRQRPQPHQRRYGASFTKSSTAQDPPPKAPKRSNTDIEITSPDLVLDENDDPYQMMLSSPARVANKEAVNSAHSMKPKPKPRPRKSHSPNSSPSIKPANPPFKKQPTASNEYVQLCGDSGTRVEEDDSTPNDATTTSASAPAVDVMSSLNQLVAGSVTRSESSESGSTVVPEDLAQSFTSSQLQLLINMLQKVQTVQGSNGEASNGEGGEGGGGGGGGGAAAAKAGGGGGKARTPLSPPGPLYEVEDTAHDHLALKGNFKRALSYAPDLPEEQILITDDDGSYLPRPEWAKATGASAIQIYGDTNDLHVDSTLSDLEEEALYISRDALEDFVPIGEGQFGQVYRAMLKHGVAPIQVAVKTAKKSSSSKEKAEFMREMTIMSQMMHPNIVRLYGVVQQDMQSPWIVLEYLRNGDLKKFLMKNKRPVKQLVKYMIDISMGMHYLAEKGLVHRDLAARNILVADNETCKVADFGLLREIPKDDSIYQMHTNVPCPVRWMPPESISQRKFSTASDVWSFGVLQWEMFNPKKMPYGSFSNMEVAMKVATGYRLPVPRNIPPVVARIMKACWHKSPEKRPSFLLISTLLTTKVTFDDE